MEGKHHDQLCNTRLTDEQMDKAIKQIVFDLGVSQERAEKWALESQDVLLKDEKAPVTTETVTVKADAAHIHDEDVPAELVPLDQGSTKFPGTDFAASVVNAVKHKYKDVKHHVGLGK